LDSLFKPFSQVDGSYTRKYGGSGLGLVISKQIVNMMQGEIKVESHLGKGTKFYFTMKLKPQKETKPVTAAKELSKIYGFPAEQEELHKDTVKQKAFHIDALKNERKKYKILLAEDNQINQKVALKILDEAGYNAKAVSNGREAIYAIKNNDYDAVLMDVQMPEMDGLTATKEIRKLDGEKGKIPIVAITAHALRGDKEKCLAAGMNDYLSKPIIPEQLIDTVDFWLNMKPDDAKIYTEEKKDHEAVFDFAHLEKMSMGDSSFKKELLASYLEDMKNRLYKLTNYIESRDVEHIINEAHTIKGASYSIGASQMGNEALAIELSGKNNDLARAYEKLSDLRKALTDTSELLMNLID